MRTADTDAPWLLQLPDRFIPRSELRKRLKSTEIDRLPYTSRLNRLYQLSDYEVYGDLEPNRDVLFLADPDHPEDFQQHGLIELETGQLGVFRWSGPAYFSRVRSCEGSRLQNITAGAPAGSP